MSSLICFRPAAASASRFNGSPNRTGRDYHKGPRQNPPGFSKQIFMYPITVPPPGRGSFDRARTVKPLCPGGRLGCSGGRTVSARFFRSAGGPADHGVRRRQVRISFFLYRDNAFRNRMEQNADKGGPAHALRLARPDVSNSLLSASTLRRHRLLSQGPDVGERARIPGPLRRRGFGGAGRPH